MELKYSNFELIKTLGKIGNHLTYYATVDVTMETGSLWWKKTSTEKKEIYREYGGLWRLSENGEPIFSKQLDNIVSLYRATSRQEC